MAVVADELLLVVKANVTQALAGLEAVENKSKGLGSKLMGAGKLAAKGLAVVGAAAGAVGVGAARMAMGFETSMAQIEALVGVPKDEMEELEAAALGMGKQFGVSADEAAGGLFFLKSAGLETSEAIETLNSTAMASAIGLGDMETLANTATTAMTNFGIDSTEAFDAIAMAAKLAKADPSALGKIMNENSASAALVGMDYDDLAGTLAFLTRKFGDANKSGTGMGGILRKLVKPSQMAKDMLDQIGVSAEEFSNMLATDLPAGLDILDAAFAESGVSQTEWLGKVFEDGEAIKAAAAIIGDTSGEIEGMLDEMGDKTGTLANGWGVMEETAGVKWAKVKESIKSALIPVGAIILDWVIPAIEVLGGWIEKGVKWFESFASGGDAVNQGLGKFLKTLGSLANYFRWVFIEGDTLNDFLADMPASLKPVIKGIGDAFVAVRETISGAIQWIKDFWAALTGANENPASGIESAVTSFMGFAELLKEGFAVAIEVVGGLIDTLVERWNAVWEVIGPVLTDMIAFIMETVQGLVDWWKDNWDNISKIAEMYLGLVKRHWERIWNAIKDHIMPLWESIKKVITGALNIIKGVIQTVMAVITGDWGKAWEGIKMVASGIWDAITGIIGTAWELLQTLFDVGIAYLFSAWDAFWSVLGNGIQAVWDGIIATVKGAINLLISALEGGINAAIGLINGAIDAFNSIPLAPDIPLVPNVNIPRLAQGGTITAGGMAMVGEEGPELLRLPRGAQVQPLGQGAGMGGPQTIIVQVGDKEFAKFVLDKSGLGRMRQARRTA